MRTLNLLPAGVLRQQRRRRCIAGMATAEAVIFLLVVLSVLWVTYALRQVRARADYLESRLADARYAATDRLAEAVKTAEAKQQARQAVSAALSSAAMDYAWLAAINRTIPPETALLEVELRDRRVTLTAQAADWQAAERHRAALAECGLFSYVRFGAASRTEDGLLRYGLSLGVV